MKELFCRIQFQTKVSDFFFHFSQCNWNLERNRTENYRKSVTFDVITTGAEQKIIIFKGTRIKNELKYFILTKLKR